MSDDSLKNNAEIYATMSEEELLLLLVPEGAEQLYNKGARLARAKSILVSNFQKVREPVCKTYARHSKSFDNSIDLIALIAQSIIKSVIKIEIPIMPMAALIVKTGLLEACKKEKAEQANGAI
jgi:hypothetical protein